MKSFKQFLIETNGQPRDLFAHSHSLEHMENLVGLDPQTSEQLKRLRQTMNRMQNEKNYTGANELFSDINGMASSEPISRLRSQNLIAQQNKNAPPEMQEINPHFPPELQRLQRENRRKSFENSGLVPPADDVTGTVSIHGSSPRIEDLASRAAAGDVNAMNLRTDEKGRLRSNLRSVGAAGLAAAGSITGSALTQGVQAAGDVLGMVGKTPAPKDRMQIEKDFQSDIGLGFNLTPEGELEADPQGREAARKRQQRGVNFTSMFKEG